MDKAEQCIDELKKLVPKDMWVPIMEQRQEQAVLERDHAEVLKNLGSLKTRPWGLVIGVNVILIALIIYFFLRKKKVSG